MKTPILLVLAACAAPTPRAQSPRIAVVPAQLPVADEAKVKADSEAFLAAYDANDAASLEAAAGPTFGVLAPGELAEQLKGWKIVKDEVVEDIADWGMTKTKLVRFIAEKP